MYQEGLCNVKKDSCKRNVYDVRNNGALGLRRRYWK